MELDARAEEACAIFAPIAGDVRRGELEGPPLFRALQDVYNEARLSEVEDVAQSAQRLLTAAINNDRRAVNQEVTALQVACNLPFN